MDKQIYWGFSGKEAKLEHVFSQIPVGWHPLVSKLIEDLFDAGWDGNLFQLKEKYGTLRFYIGGGAPAIHELVHTAEDNSGSICQDCGACGKLRSEAFKWLYTLCDEHAKQRGYGESSL